MFMANTNIILIYIYEQCIIVFSLLHKILVIIFHGFIILFLFYFLENRRRL